MTLAIVVVANVTWGSKITISVSLRKQLIATLCGIQILRPLSARRLWESVTFPERPQRSHFRPERKATKTQRGGRERPTGTYTHTHTAALRSFRKSALWTGTRSYSRRKTWNLQKCYHLMLSGCEKNTKLAWKTRLLLCNL